MPYIHPDQRELINGHVDELAWHVRAIANTHAKRSGLINYVVTRLLLSTVLPEVSYKNLVLATGILETCKLEMYRRLAAPYEDAKAEENGDVYA